MTYQSEAQLEQLLIQRLKSQGFDEVKIDNEQELMENFKKKFSLFNQDKLKNKPLTEKEWQRVTNDILGKGVFASAKKLRTRCLSRGRTSRIYIWICLIQLIYRKIYLRLRTRRLLLENTQTDMMWRCLSMGFLLSKSS